MRWIKKHGKLLMSAVAYVLFFCVSLTSFRLFLSPGVGMDSLIAFLLSQTLGMVVLHIMRRMFNLRLQRRLLSRQYGKFLLVNAMVILFNALVMYVLDLMSSYNEVSLQIFATCILAGVNVIMQILHMSEPVVEVPQEQ